MNIIILCQKFNSHADTRNYSLFKNGRSQKQSQNGENSPVRTKHGSMWLWRILLSACCRAHEWFGILYLDILREKTVEEAVRLFVFFSSNYLKVGKFRPLNFLVH